MSITQSAYQKDFGVHDKRHKLNILNPDNMFEGFLNWQNSDACTYANIAPHAEKSGFPVRPYDKEKRKLLTEKQAEKSPGAGTAFMAGDQKLIFIKTSGPNYRLIDHVSDLFVSDYVMSPITATCNGHNLIMLRAFGDVTSQTSNQHEGSKIEILAEGELVVEGENLLRWADGHPTRFDYRLLPCISMRDIEVMFRDFSDVYAARFNWKLDALGTMESPAKEEK